VHDAQIDLAPLIFPLAVALLLKALVIFSRKGTPRPGSVNDPLADDVRLIVPDKKWASDVVRA
jgi:hypothetical protein